MRATASLSVILVAAILALGDGAFLVEDNRDAQRGKMATEFVIHIVVIPEVPYSYSISAGKI